MSIRGLIDGYAIQVGVGLYMLVLKKLLVVIFNNKGRCLFMCVRVCVCVCAQCALETAAHRATRFGKRKFPPLSQLLDFLRVFSEFFHVLHRFFPH